MHGYWFIDLCIAKVRNLGVRTIDAINKRNVRPNYAQIYNKSNVFYLYVLVHLVNIFSKIYANGYIIK